MKELESFDNVIFELLYDATHDFVDPAWNKLINENSLTPNPKYFEHVDWLIKSTINITNTVNENEMYTNNSKNNSKTNSNSKH